MIEKKNISDKIFEVQTRRTIKCKCGHSIVFWRRDRQVVCSWCGRLVKMKDRDDFKKRIKELIKGE